MTYQGFRFFDVLMPEEELAIEIAEIDGVEIDNVDLTETCEYEVLEELAPDPSSSYEKYARLRGELSARLPSMDRLSKH